jgi:hypothetical protein
VTVTGATCDSNNLEMQEISPLLMRLSSNAGSGSEEKTKKFCGRNDKWIHGNLQEPND